MNCTHIIVLTEGFNSKAVSVCVYDEQGAQVYKADMELKGRPDIKATGAIDNVTREDVVRFITRNCLEFDVAMSTPMFGIRN